MRKWIFTAESQILQLSLLNVVVRVDGICCLLSVTIDRSVEPNRTGKRNQVNSTRNRRVELKSRMSRQDNATFVKQSLSTEVVSYFYLP